MSCILKISRAQYWLTAKFGGVLSWNEAVFSVLKLPVNAEQQPPRHRPRSCTTIVIASYDITAVRGNPT